MKKEQTAKPQQIVVFQQNGSGENKIQGILKYGKNLFKIETISVDEYLPAVIDDGIPYLPNDIRADVVLDYLKHPDLSYDLAIMCREKNIPVVVSGKKVRVKGVYSPPTWCGLSRQVRLGLYGEKFGAPEFSVKVEAGKITDIAVKRGAPCGATWEAALRVGNMPAEEAIIRMGLETQFFCTADPASWDPIYGKSPVHFAGDVHAAALKKAINNHFSK